MKKEIEQKKYLKNIEGKRLLEKTYLEYSLEILKQLEKNPTIISEVLSELEITEKEFIDYLSGKTSANITLYDQALTLVKAKNKNSLINRK